MTTGEGDASRPLRRRPRPTAAGAHALSSYRTVDQRPATSDNGIICGTVGTAPNTCAHIRARGRGAQVPPA